MKLSDKLYETTIDMWEESTKKPFVMEMANGTLHERKYRKYMLQDYFYINDYIEILEKILEIAEGKELKDFLEEIIETTRGELEKVHIPNMNRLGITGQELRCTERTPENSEYVDYLRKLVETEGVIPGLTALLHCSWVYAYIARSMVSRYPKEIEHSSYKSWFEAYACDEYNEANQMWIDMVDKETEGISPEETERLCRIFKECAVFENRFWDMVEEDDL